jgi:hypothetical protein
MKSASASCADREKLWRDQNVSDNVPRQSARRLVRDILITEPGVDDKMANELSALLLSAFSRWLAIEATADVPAGGALPRRQENTAFDPYSFGAVAVLMREGRPALLHRLAQIEDVAELRQLAAFQHLSLPPGLDDIETLREAIATSAERRLSGRLHAARA